MVSSELFIRPSRGSKTVTARKLIRIIADNPELIELAERAVEKEAAFHKERCESLAPGDAIRVALMAIAADLDNYIITRDR